MDIQINNKSPQQKITFGTFHQESDVKNAVQMKPAVGDPRHGNMAGNIVKWWKHKILGGYKQFSGNFFLYTIGKGQGRLYRYIMYIVKYVSQHSLPLFLKDL